MSNFLCGPGFEALSQAFGWPIVKTWVVWRAELSPAIAEAKFATREILAIPPYAPLSDLRARGNDEAAEDIQAGALGRRFRADDMDGGAVSALGRAADRA